MLIGYARVSTSMQDLQLQVDALTAAGCEQIFTDTATGKNFERTGLQDALKHLRKGDCFTVWKLDRLGRNVRDMLNLAADLDARGINLQSLTDKIDTTLPHGRFYFTVMAALAEMERELMRERTRAALDVARRAGKRGGRPLRMTDKKIDAAKKLLLSNTSPRDVASMLGISIPTLYRHVPASSLRILDESA